MRIRNWWFTWAHPVRREELSKIRTGNMSSNLAKRFLVVCTAVHGTPGELFHFTDPWRLWPGRFNVRPESLLLPRRLWWPAKFGNRSASPVLFDKGGNPALREVCWFFFFPLKVAELIKKKADSYLPILCPFHLLPNIKPPAAFARTWLV